MFLEPPISAHANCWILVLSPDIRALGMQWQTQFKWSVNQKVNLLVHGLQLEKKKCVDPSSGKSGSKTSTAGTIGSSFFCCCFSLKFVFIPLTDSGLVKWCRLTETIKTLIIQIRSGDLKWNSLNKSLAGKTEFLRWLVRRFFKQKDSWTVFTVYKQKILKHPDLRGWLAALWRVQEVGLPVIERTQLLPAMRAEAGELGHPDLSLLLPLDDLPVTCFHEAHPTRNPIARELRWCRVQGQPPRVTK